MDWSLPGEIWKQDWEHEREALLQFQKKQMIKIAQMEIKISEHKSLLESKDNTIKKLQQEISTIWAEEFDYIKLHSKYTKLQAQYQSLQNRFVQANENKKQYQKDRISVSVADLKPKANYSKATCLIDADSKKTQKGKLIQKTKRIPLLEQSENYKNKYYDLDQSDEAKNMGAWKQFENSKVAKSHSYLGKENRPVQHRHQESYGSGDRSLNKIPLRTRLSLRVPQYPHKSPSSTHRPLNI